MLASIEAITVDNTRERQGVDMISPSTRCQYKTGRCPYPRAIKANGTRLLLCEYHRGQQNRTKKRSDMKCRHNRAQKRQAQREQLQFVKRRAIVATEEEGDTSYPLSLLSPLSRISSVLIDDDDDILSEALESDSSVDDDEKSFESGSPTSIDLDVSLMDWPASSPSSPSVDVLDDATQPDDLWLLGYFIL